MNENKENLPNNHQEENKIEKEETIPTTSSSSEDNSITTQDTSSNKEEKQRKKKKKKSIFVRILLFLLILIIIFVVTAIATSLWFVNDKLDKLNYVNDVTKEDVSVDTQVDESLSEYRNIALLGIDTRDDTFTGSRSDCIIIVSINNNTKDVKLLSVYRDTYLDIEGHGLDKVTHAYAYGGPRLTLSTLNRNLDLNISEFVTVNFETVRTVVNAIGGVDITVTAAEASQISGLSGAGTYTLDGAQALAYSRIRKIDTDYQRTERMRTVLNAVFEKVKKLDLAQLNSLLDTVLPHLSTNISKNDIIALLPDLLSYNVTDSEGWPYETRSITLNLWYGIPVTLEENVKQLHENLFGEENYEPSETVKSISNQIIQKTGYSN